MKFAFDTCREIIAGDADRRVRALATFGVWFAAGAFTVSTLMHYFASVEGMSVDLVGGIVVASLAMTAKLF